MCPKLAAQTKKSHRFAFIGNFEPILHNRRALIENTLKGFRKFHNLDFDLRLFG